MIQMRQEERITDVRRALQSIASIRSQTNTTLKFVIADDDQPCTPNMTDGLVLVPLTDANMAFVKFVHDTRWDIASRVEMLEPKYFLHLMHLEKEYIDFSQKRKRFLQAGLIKPVDEAPELEISHDPFTYAARMKGEQVDAANRKLYGDFPSGRA